MAQVVAELLVTLFDTVLYEAWSYERPAPVSESEIHSLQIIIETGAAINPVENFRVGGLGKFGLDYESLAPENPRLVYASVTGFGQDGPRAAQPGYDFLVQGMSGIMDLTGDPGGELRGSGADVRRRRRIAVRT